MKQTAAMVTEQIWMLLNDVSLACFLRCASVFVAVAYPCNSRSVFVICVTNNYNPKSNSTDG